MSNNKHEKISTILDFVLGFSIILSMILCLAFFTTLTSAAETTSGNSSSIAVEVVQPVVVSSNYTSGNTLSGGITYDQGDYIIHLLRLILFMIVFSWCFERVRNGVRSLKNTH